MQKEPFLGLLLMKIYGALAMLPAILRDALVKRSALLASPSYASPHDRLDRQETGSHSSEVFRGGGPPPVCRWARSYDVVSNTWRTVAAYHWAPPWAVGTPSRLRLSAMFLNESPRAR
jgi:hypothetical protein